MLSIGSLTACTVGLSDFNIGVDSGFVYDDPAGDGSYDDPAGDGSEYDDDDDDVTYEDDTGDGGSSSSGPEAPEINIFSATVSGDVVRFEFELDDPDGDLEGGDVTLSVGGDTESYGYPNGLSWVGQTAYVEWAQIRFDYGQSYTGLLEVTDTSGNSATDTTSFVTDPWSTTVSETGDLFLLEQVVQIGMVGIPAEIYGNMHSTGNDGLNPTGDVDLVEIKLPSSGSYTVTLDWSASADYDLYIYDSSGQLLQDSLTRGYSAESISRSFTGNSNYFIGAVGWSGPGGDWTIRID